MARNTILLTATVLVFLFSGYMVFIYGPMITERERDNVVHQAYAKLLNFVSNGIPDSVYVQRLVGRVSKYKWVECSNIGYSGLPSTQFSPVNYFIKLATDAQLVRIINQENPIAKHYAFAALVHNNPGLAKKVMGEHINDTQTYQFFCGCLVEPCPININFFYTISFYLTPIEHSIYKEQLQKQYKGTHFQLECEYL